MTDFQFPSDEPDEVVYTLYGEQWYSLDGPDPATEDWLATTDPVDLQEVR